MKLLDSHPKEQHEAELFIFYALCQLLADNGSSHEAFLQAYPKLSWGEHVLRFYLTPFLQAKLDCRCCAAQRVRGRETKKECASWKGKLFWVDSGQIYDKLRKSGRKGESLFGW